jgi:hypothetical protein
MAIEHQCETERGMSETSEQPADDALDELTKARALIAAEEAQRVQECGAEIEAVLAKYGMTLEPVASLQLRPRR